METAALLGYTVCMSKTAILIIGIAIILIFAALTVLLLYKIGLANAVFTYCFSRSDKQKWSRNCSNRNDRALLRMWDSGVEWAQENKDAKSEIETVSGGITLAAQYFDFGFDKAVIITHGMFESSMYSYYYAEVFKQAGFNCLLPDSRAHGLSDGSFMMAGGEEKRDIIEWAALLHDRYGIKNIILHGIAMGASSTLLAANEADCPSYVKGLILDGCYPEFEDYFKRFLELRKFGAKTYGSAMKKLYRRTGVSADSVSSIKTAKDIEIPALFIVGKKDELVPEDAGRRLFDEYGSECANKAKQLLLLERGTSEKLRFADPEEYDEAVSEFLKTLNL